MEKTKEQQNDIQISASSKLLQRIIFDWMLLIIFLSFAIFTMVELPQFMHRSLSGLGWRVQIDGKKYKYLSRLFFYTFFTIGFLVYQVRLLTKQSSRKHHTINWVMWVGSLFLLVGTCIPVSTDREAIKDILHSRFCQAGTLIMAISIALMVVAYCRETKTTINTKAMIVVPCLIVLALGVLGLCYTGDPGAIVTAPFTFMSTFMVMVYTHFLTVSYELAPQKDTVKPIKDLFKRRQNDGQQNQSTAGK